MFNLHQACRHKGSIGRVHYFIMNEVCLGPRLWVLKIDMTVGQVSGTKGEGTTLPNSNMPAGPCHTPEAVEHSAPRQILNEHHVLDC